LKSAEPNFGETAARRSFCLLWCMTVI
jgi:hypothetical protein